MTDSAPDTHGQQDHADPPALAATDPRPCPYCWQPPDDDYDMTNISDPRYTPEGGFAPVHPECERAVTLHAQEAEI